MRSLRHRKLQTLATRIPLFMYLTDFREEKLTDVVMKLEPELFMRVTGLTIDDFKLLIKLGLFNSELMNDVVYKFRVYEDSSVRSYVNRDLLSLRLNRLKFCGCNLCQANLRNA